MTWTYTDDYYREYTRTTWNESAAVWTRYAPVLAEYRADLVRAAAIKKGERVLDIATGSGEPALTVARQAGPKGKVVGVDLSEKLIEVAQRAAKDQGVSNAEFLLMDAEALTLPDRSFDAAVSAFGFQIVTNPEKAASEALRVLKPGGRIALTVWAQAERCQALHTIVGPMLEFAEPDETGYIPTPYELGGPGEMVAFLEKAGFRDGREQRVVHDWRFADEDHFFEFALQGTPLGHSLREEDAEVQKQVLRKTKEALKAWKRTPQGIAMPAEAVIVTARRT